MKDWTGNAKSIYATLGASNHTDAEREDNDFYATEPKALILLLERETFDDLIWEPACGKGHLSEVLKQSGYIVKSTDLVDRGYRNTWDCVIVDECHRCAGSPTSLNQFATVLNNLACPHKYGLSATVHRADGLTKTIFCFLGNIAYSVPDSAVADKVMAVEVRRRNTGVQIAQQCLDTDGTLIFQNMVSYLAQSNRRNYSIVNDLVVNADHFNLILSERLMHLDALMDMLPDELRKQSVMIDGKMTSKAAKAFRKQAIDEMREGKKHFLFASYRLAKEGLDIPRLDRLYLVTPQKDYTTIVQSVGRIARTFPEKDTPVCYDYVDDIDYLVRTFKTRCRHYRKCGCTIKEDE